MSDKKTVIAINRGFGSGGRIIGGMLSERLGVHFYDKELIYLASEESGINAALFGQADENLRKSFFKKNFVYDHKILPPDSSDFTSDDNLFNYQAKIIRDLAEESSCVIVGRCADFILRDMPNVISVFVYASQDACVKNVCELYGVDEKEALKIITKTDKRRADYQRYYSGTEWDNARNYDLSLDSSKLGFEKCVDIIEDYIKIFNR